jgi:hypothetical protein
MSSPVEVPERNHRGIVFIYDLPTYGRTVVAEAQVDISPNEWLQSVDRQARRNATRTAPATAERVSVRGNVPALLLTDEITGRTAIEWLEGQTRFAVMGPNLSRDACLKIAEQV